MKIRSLILEVGVKITLVATILGVLGACTHRRYQNHVSEDELVSKDWQEHQQDPKIAPSPNRIVQLAEKPGTEAIKELIQEVDHEVEGEGQQEHSIPLEVNERVEAWIAYFTGKARNRFQRYLNRGAKYKKLIASTLEEYEVPKDLYYLALIESGFSTKARSHAHAVGIWQFIRGTGKRYGLRMDYDVDERQDPRRATAAAAQYLRDLHRVFQDWYLAMAAYNSGEMRIIGAIMRSNTRDFWELADRKALPRETMNYIPKFIAASIIGRHPDRFGFIDPAPQRSPEVVAAQIPPSVPLNKLAKTLKMTRRQLNDLNPHVKGNTSPSRNYQFWLPTSAAAIAKLKKSTIASYRVRGSRNYAAHGTTYRVRKGDHLAKIARKFGTSVGQIKRWNNLRSDRILVGKRLVVGKASRPTGKGSHIVRRGETLGKIARKYRVRISDIKRWNRLRSDKIFVGKRLVIGSAGSSTKYRVRRGDSLHGIASKFKISVSRLKRLNRLRHNRIYAGQVLTIGHRG